jgi:hypothetical protein
MPAATLACPSGYCEGPKRPKPSPPAGPRAPAPPSRTPPLLLPGVNASAIDAGLDHTCALVLNGGVMCWGDNYAGQLGVGDKVVRQSPVAVTGARGCIHVLKCGHNS